MPPSLQAAMDALPRPKNGPHCTIGELLATLNKSDRVRLAGWLAESPKVLSHNRIKDALKNAGYTIGRETISKHRRPGGCDCEAV